jgi:hypothetical protein
MTAKTKSKHLKLVEKPEPVDVAREFITWLTSSPDTPMRFRLLDDDKARALPPIEFEGAIDNEWGTTWDRIHDAQAQGYAAYYFLNEVRPGPGSGSNGAATDTDVVKVRAIPADFDKSIPTEWHSTPDILVHTSPGRGQALWLGEHPLYQFKPICRRIIAYYPGADPQVCNLSRILRLPGSIHQKPGKPKSLVTCERFPNG